MNFYDHFIKLKKFYILLRVFCGLSKNESLFTWSLSDSGLNSVPLISYYCVKSRIYQYDFKTLLHTKLQRISVFMSSILFLTVGLFYWTSRGDRSDLLVKTFLRQKPSPSLFFFWQQSSSSAGIISKDI